MHSLIVLAQQVPVAGLGIKLDYTINVGNFSTLIAILLTALRSFNLLNKTSLKVNAMWKYYCETNKIDPSIFDSKESIFPGFRT